MVVDNGLETKIATFVLLRHCGKTLMLHRDKDSSDFLYGKYVPPGGRIEPLETPEQCAVREYKEETDLEIRDLVYRGRVLFDNHKRNFQGKPAKFNFLVHIYEAYSFTGTMKSEVGTLLWVTDSELKNLDVERGDLYIFDILEKGIKLNHRIILSDDSADIKELSPDFPH